MYCMVNYLAMDFLRPSKWYILFENRFLHNKLYWPWERYLVYHRVLYVYTYVTSRYMYAVSLKKNLAGVFVLSTMCVENLCIRG